jgi:two-component system chemotaxis response regulator CheB
MTQPIRVLIVDDSAFVRKVLREMLSTSPRLEVVGQARNGEEALELVETLQPDVVTLDLIMPEMDGLTFLKKQGQRRRLPVVVVSIASEDGDLVMDALEAGALDFVQKPTALANDRVYEIAAGLVQKVILAAEVPPQHLPTPVPLAAPVALPPHAAPTGKLDAVVIGVSTGGPQALSQLIPSLPAGFPAALAVVLHMPVGYTGPFARRLNDQSHIEVLEAMEGDEMRPGRMLLAPAGQHLSLVKTPEGRILAHLSLEPSGYVHRPAADILFKSAAEAYGDRLLGVVMTGMGNDGQEGAAWIKAQGGQMLAESEETCVVYGMPRCVIEAGLADRIVPLPRIAQAILDAL